jgi:predicted transcriptional regulator
MDIKEFAEAVTPIVVACIHSNTGLSANNASLTSLIADVSRAVVQSLEPVPVAPPAPELVPAVPIKKSVTDQFIVCLEDGEKFKSLKRHIKSKYDLTPEQYRAKWGLPADYPMVAPAYSQSRSELAKNMGLGLQRRKPAKAA